MHPTNMKQQVATVIILNKTPNTWQWDPCRGLCVVNPNTLWRTKKTEKGSLHPRPCTMPDWMDNKIEEDEDEDEDEDENTGGSIVWRRKNPCFCHASMRGFAATNKCNDIYGLLEQLMPFYKIIHNDKKTNSSKTAFCYFHRALVPVYEKDDKDKIWTHYHFVLRGDDVRPSKEKRHAGFGRLCRHALAMLLGKWTPNDNKSIQRHDERAFSVQFYHSCIEPRYEEPDEEPDKEPEEKPDKTKKLCTPRLHDSVTVAEWFDNGYKNNLLRNLILEVAILCLIEEEGYVPTGDVYLPRSPAIDKVFYHWYAAKLLPITKSIVLSHETFKEHSKVLQILGTEDNNQVQSMQIADHRLRYVSPQGETTNACLDIYSWRQYFGNMPGDDGNPILDVMAAKVPAELLNILTKLWQNEMPDIIPKRVGPQKFMDSQLQPYHKGMTTFFEASTYFDDSKGQQSGDGGAFTQKFTGTSEGVDLQATLNNLLREMFSDALLKGLLHDTHFDKPKYFIFRFDFRQCRFSTNYKERVPPHLEFGKTIPSKLDEHDCRLVTCIIPVHELGVWVRLFLNENDRHGVLVKVMHGSALIYESSKMAIELGRCTHHEGNPYFAFHLVLYNKRRGPNEETRKMLKHLDSVANNTREYIHFPKTFKTTGEEGMRKVTPNVYWVHSDQDWNTWKNWESATSKRVEEMCGC